MKITLPVSKKTIDLKDSLTHGEVSTYELEGFKGLVRDKDGNVEDFSYMQAAKRQQEMLVNIISGLSREEVTDLNESDFVFALNECAKIMIEIKKKGGSVLKRDEV